MGAHFPCTQEPHSLPARVDAQLEWDLPVDSGRSNLLNDSCMSSGAWLEDEGKQSPRLGGGTFPLPDLLQAKDLACCRWQCGVAQLCLVEVKEPTVPFAWFAFQMFHIINRYGEKLVKIVEKKVANDEFVTVKE